MPKPSKPIKTPAFLGIDIGGTNTKFGIISPTHACIASYRMPTPRGSAQHFFSMLTDKIQEALHQHPYTIAGMGIGAPNAHAHTGSIHHPPNLNWAAETPLKAWFEKQWSCPVCLMNDADAAAWGEYTYGHARGLKHFAYLTLGTGLGSAFVIEGELLQGATGIAAELGHVIIHPQGRPCHCGKKGCLEAYVSAAGLQQTANDLLTQPTQPTQHTQHRPAERANVEDMAKKASRGDKIAQQAFEVMGQTLGQALANVMNIMGSEAIFIAGGLAKASAFFLPTLKSEMEKGLVKALKASVRIAPSALLDQEPAVLGSVAYLRYRLKL